MANTAFTIIRKVFGFDSSESEESDFDTFDVSGDTYVHVASPKAWECETYDTDQDHLNLSNLELGEDFKAASPDLKIIKLENKYKCNTQLMESLLREAGHSPRNRSNSTGDNIEMIKAVQNKPVTSQGLSKLDSCEGATNSNGRGNITGRGREETTPNGSLMSNIAHVDDYGSDGQAYGMKASNEFTVQEMGKRYDSHTGKLLIEPSITGNIATTSESSESEDEMHDYRHGNMAIKQRRGDGQRAKLSANGRRSGRLNTRYSLSKMAMRKKDLTLSSDDDLSVIPEEVEKFEEEGEGSPRKKMETMAWTGTPKKSPRKSSPRKPQNFTSDSKKWEEIEFQSKLF